MLIVGIIGLLAVLTAILWAAVALIRYAIREGEGQDPRWGMVGVPDPGSEIVALSSRLYVVPTSRTLVLRSSPNKEPAWEREFAWAGVDVSADETQVVLSGPFGVIRCLPDSSETLDQALAHMSPTYLHG
ncbi:MAG: hypothetical protein WC005_01075 [Candidatus Nanopelagicales bacterium]